MASNLRRHLKFVPFNHRSVTVMSALISHSLHVLALMWGLVLLWGLALKTMFPRQWACNLGDTASNIMCALTNELSSRLGETVSPEMQGQSPRGSASHATLKACTLICKTQQKFLGKYAVQALIRPSLKCSITVHVAQNRSDVCLPEEPGYTQRLNLDMLRFRQRRGQGCQGYNCQ